MSIYEEIKETLYNKINYKFQESNNIPELKSYCIQELEKIITSGELDIRKESEAHQACVLYGDTTWDYFFSKGFEPIGFAILISGWNLFSSYQVQTNQHIYRAGISAFLAMRYRNIGDDGATFRWSLLTQAEDLLGEHEQGGSTGRDLLLADFGLDPRTLEKLKEIAMCNLELIKGKRNWSIPESFAEDVVNKFAYQNPEYANFFALSTKIFEYKINKAYFDALIKSIDAYASTTTEKGKSLEDLSTYLFLLIPGLVPRRNLHEETNAFESDIVISNHTNSANIISELLGRHFLIECKNWEDHVGVKDIGYFLFRMRLTHAHFGIVFAKNGITGDNDEEKAACSLLRKAFNEDGIICIVIDKKDLEKLKDDSISFWPLLLERIERIRFGSGKKN